MWRQYWRIQAVVALPLVLGLMAALPAVGRTGAAWDEVTLARVDQEPITLDDLDREIGAMAGRVKNARELDLPSGDLVLRRLIQNRLLEHEGRRMEDASTSRIPGQVRDMIRNRSIVALMDSVAATVTDSDLSGLDSLLEVTNRMLRVAHILVDERATALSLLDSLNNGIEFSALVLGHSQDSSTVAVGGDLGWAREDAYIPSFAKGLAELSPGEVSSPVQSDRGWHLLKLTDSREETAGQSEEMKQAIIKRATQEAGLNAIRSYCAHLREKYDVVVNDSLLAGLDYASADPEMQAYLRDSEDALTVLPTGRLTVRGLSRKMRFKYFHGLIGRPEASSSRDKMLDEWIDETLLIHEASQLGFDKRPELLQAAEAFERELLREATVEVILDFPWQPTQAEIEAYYGAHKEMLLPEPRVRVRAIVFATEEAGQAFREKVNQGTAFGWLAERTSGVVDPDPKSFRGFVEPRQLGVRDAGELQREGLVGPLSVPEGWLVAQFTAVEPVSVPPLTACRDQVLALMKRERTQEVISQALLRLEEAAEIEINPKAEDLITDRLQEWQASGDAQPTATGQGPDQQQAEER